MCVWVVPQASVLLVRRGVLCLTDRLDMVGVPFWCCVLPCVLVRVGIVGSSGCTVTVRLTDRLDMVGGVGGAGGGIHYFWMCVCFAMRVYPQ